MSVREDEQRKNPSRGLGLAAAAIGVGVGAALYYFFSKRPEHPNSEGSTSENWHCEHPQTLYGSLADTSYTTVSEHTTTDTSVYDSSHTWDNEDSFSTYHDSFTSDHDSFTSDHDSFSSDHDSFSMISSESEYESASNVSGSVGDISRNTSIENVYDEPILEINDTTPVQIEAGSVETDQEMYVINESEIVTNGTANGLSFEIDLMTDPTVDINDTTTASVAFEITEPSETSESGWQETSESTTSTFETSNTGNTVSIDERDDWDVTNTSLDVPASNDTSPSRNSPLSRIYKGWSSIIGSRTRTRSGRRQNEQITEEEQMAILRQEAFRERSWSLEECSICFEVMLKDQPLMQLPCAHNFHVACIGPWLQEQQTCPNCRKSAE
ncbi:uncharacterized protein LOC113229195 isoform X1 [Hyposmocoma kahamanoa]|uniref:uncharacterized protein LOC113229195 isoform X1 n=1 Tax=Hyposmocoma kahamanoa TaxID=1477025 RepID=UPI000E6D6B15|nr:uncharacterized protein LOC113229195 isoform X1 [Hyposmocoma kahamanoa]